MIALPNHLAYESLIELLNHPVRSISIIVYYHLNLGAAIETVNEDVLLLEPEEPSNQSRNVIYNNEARVGQ